MNGINRNLVITWAIVMVRATWRIWLALFIASVTLSTSGTAGDLPVVPGTGTLIDFVGDSFEEPGWEFIHNHPKSSREQDERTRFPRGFSANGRWFEGPERGQPDLMRVVPAPDGALPGSAHALLVRTRNSGIPGFYNNQVEQDDLIVDCVARLSGPIPVVEIPNIVTRVYLPPAGEWENRSGPHFGFRGTTNCIVTKTEEQQRGRFRLRPQTYKTRDPYWPGIWIHFRSDTDPGVETDSAFLAVRGNKLGHDFPVRDISQDEFGWWTLGMSFTASGMIHYYASPGVDELTADDYLTSQYPYARQAEFFETMFFNYCNRNDGRTWSTPFLIDDPRLYVVRSQRVVSLVNQKRQQMARQEAQQKQAERDRAKQQWQQQQSERQATQRTARVTTPMPRRDKDRLAPQPKALNPAG